MRLWNVFDLDTAPMLFEVLLREARKLRDIIQAHVDRALYAGGFQPPAEAGGKKTTASTTIGTEGCKIYASFIHVRRDPWFRRELIEGDS
jgi:hypothetical protein